MAEAHAGHAGSPPDPFALGLDIGGSSVKAALVRIGDGRAPDVVDTSLWPLDPARAPSDVIDVLHQATERYRTEFGVVKSIGVGLPGMFDAKTGSPTLLPNFPPEWRGFPFRKTVEQRLAAEVTVVNDAKAFSVAESVVGAAAGKRMVVCVVLGTGVGGGIVLDGRIWKGRGSAGELGHLTVELGGPRCGCGNTGCVEAFASAAAISAYGRQSTVLEVFEAAAGGDVIAQGSIDRATKALGAGLANVFITLAPDVFVIGGGVAAAGEQLIVPLEREIRRRVKVAPGTDIQVIPALLGRYAGAIGAAIMGAQSTASD
jgi:glucokinase